MGDEKQTRVQLSDPIKGAALLLMGGEIDSDSRPLLPNEYYRVAKEPASGKTMIIKEGTHGI